MLAHAHISSLGYLCFDQTPNFHVRKLNDRFFPIQILLFWMLRNNADARWAWATCDQSRCKVALKSKFQAGTGEKNC